MSLWFQQNITSSHDCAVSTFPFQQLTNKTRIMCRHSSHSHVVIVKVDRRRHTLAILEFEDWEDDEMYIIQLIWQIIVWK